MRSGASKRWEVLRNEDGQVVVEYLMLMIVSMVVGFMLLIALSQVVDALYGKLEGQVKKPTHF